MHYNEGADLLTYLVDPLVFEIINGYVKALTGSSSMRPPCYSSHTDECSSDAGPGLGIEINEALVREMAAKYADEKAWRNAVWTGPDGALREW